MLQNVRFIAALNRWLDPVYQRFDWIALALVVFVLVIPKFPLIPVEGIYVNIRVEDFIIAFVYALWLLGYLAGRFHIKQVLNSHVILFFLAYGFLITLLGINVFGTIDAPKLALLHWLRRVEYMGMFFVAATVVKREHLKAYIYILLATGIFTWIYGFLQWKDIVPGVHTLSKSGQLGTFSEIGYVISTFAAHYDFAAFIILMLIFSIWGYYTHTKWWQKILFVVLAFAFWWMSRLVYGRAAYLGMLVAAIFIFLIKRSAWVLVPIWEVFQTFSRYFGGQFSKYTYEFKFNILPSPMPTPIPVEPTRGPLRPEPELTITPAPGGNLGGQAEAAQTWLDARVHELSLMMRTYLSRLDVNFDPSANIRLQLWQDSMAKVGYHFMWGGGYGINGVGTDGDYVRHVVEVGVIGLAVFLLLLLDFVRTSWRNFRDETNDTHTRHFHLAMIAFIIGLLIEALFIDIFAASKIAILFWFLMGVVAIYHKPTASTQSA